MTGFFKIAPYRIVTLFALFAGLSCSDSCGCGDDGLVSTQECTVDSECLEEGTYFRYGECLENRCSDDVPCCPGSTCRNVGGTSICLNRLLDAEYACIEDRECPNRGQRCLELSLQGGGTTSACQFERCTNDQECRSKLNLPSAACFNSTCVAEAPCQGACGLGEICDVLTDTCFPIPDSADASCRRSSSCPNRGILVLDDPDSMSGETCCEVQCSCVDVPPLGANRFGRYPSMGLANSELLVSAYDADYGDLILAHYDQASRELLYTEFVDGMPTTGTVSGNPNGPRGGYLDPGPDVGTHTSLVLSDSGQARIAYYDRDNHSLKFASRSPSGWDVHTVDTPRGEARARVGAYASLTVDTQNSAYVIAYLVDNATFLSGAAPLKTGLRIARSSTLNPTSDSDWTFFDISTKAEFDACGGSCAGSQDCVLSGGTPECRSRQAGCAQTCGDSRSCVSLPAPDASGSTVGCLPHALPPEFEGLPRAHGLHPSVVVSQGVTYVAYYDSAEGNLLLSIIPANGTPFTRVIDGDGVGLRDEGDIGRFPSIILDGSDILIAYTDFSRHQLKVWQGQQAGDGSISIIDDGSESVDDGGNLSGIPGMRFVGADATLVKTGSRLRVFYQDATTLDLKVADRAGDGSWSRRVLAAAGANGFFVDTVVSGEQVFVVHTVGDIDARGTETSRLSILLDN